MNINYPHIASQFFGKPMLMDNNTFESVKAVLVPRMLGQSVAQVDAKSEVKTIPSTVDEKSSVCVIPIHGAIVSRAGMIDASCQELTSYERLRNQITTVLDDDAVKHIVLDMNSGGGMVSGCPEFCRFVRQATSVKPITALVNFHAYSACYWIASACSEIVCSPSGGVGSIGVIMETYELSKAESEFGIKYTTFYRGDNKNNFSTHEEITDESVAEAERMLDKNYAQFTSAVAEYRGLDVEAVIDTQAGCFMSDEALELGLIDKVQNAQDYINDLSASYQQHQQRSIQAQALALSVS